jgi:hypothetical protein
MIEVQELTKTYRHFTAVKRLSFRADPGQNHRLPRAQRGRGDPDTHLTAHPAFGAAIALMGLYMVVLSAIALGVEQRRDVD